MALTRCQEVNDGLTLLACVLMHMVRSDAHLQDLTFSVNPERYTVKVQNDILVSHKIKKKEISLISFVEHCRTRIVECVDLFFHFHSCLN